MVVCNRDLVFYSVDPYVSNQVNLLNKETEFKPEHDVRIILKQSSYLLSI